MRNEPERKIRDTLIVINEGIEENRYSLFHRLVKLTGKKAKKKRRPIYWMPELKRLKLSQTKGSRSTNSVKYI